jgi:hypothetical protein
LVYNPLYEGDKYEFDLKYFLFLWEGIRL